MKSLYLRSGATGALALACALVLGGCGGSPAELSLGGQVTGLTKSGLVIQNNGGPDLAIDSTATSFIFPELIAADEQYNVTIKTQPTGAVCTVNSGSGRSAYNVSSVVISCVTNSYDLGGSVSGLTCVPSATLVCDKSLVLNNGSVSKVVATGSTTFTMSTPVQDTAGTVLGYVGRVADGSPYGVTVFQQPSGKTCTVTNGVGVMGSAPVTTVKVDCI